MFKHEGFKKGDVIRAADFDRAADRKPCYIEGVVIEVRPHGNDEAPFAHYAVAVFRDVYCGDPIIGVHSRNGWVMHVPMETSMDWDGRVMLLTITTEAAAS